MIHKTAVISDGAQIADTAEIGPFAVIGPNVKIGPGTKIGAHCVIDGYTTIGSDCHLFAGVSVGLEPQDLGYKNEPTGVIIGDRVTLREYVTVHRGTGEGFTKIGNDCFLMNYVHIAHDCKLGNGIILANGTMFAGHCTIEDNVVMSGMNIFHQHVRVGRLAMVSGLTGTRNDLPPFSMCDGRPASVRGLNIIGMRRAKFSPAVRAAIKLAYKLIYKKGLTRAQGIALVEEQVEQYPEVREIVEFFRSSKRGVTSFTGSEDAEIMEAVPVDAI
jgi:UDP-N-acetylglucosamine acyltransferase